MTSRNSNAGDFAKFFYDLLDESSPNPLVSAAARKEMSNLKVLSSGYFKVQWPFREGYFRNWFLLWGIEPWTYGI